ncbi:MAG: DUF4384 domain-containing protein [Alphaproteobacteria bacterium]
MRDRSSSFGFLGAVLAMLLAFSAMAADRPATRTLVPVPYNKTPNVEVMVSTDRSELRIGEVVTICFQASKVGYVTLWNVSAEGRVGRIFPNPFQPAEADAMRIEAKYRYCAGKEGDPFRFQVAGPTGLDDLYLLWTADPGIQPRPAD